MALLLVLLLACCAPHSARAQLMEHRWQLLARMPKRVKTVFFQDLPGPPRVGFAATDGMIYRTSDGGATWQTTTSDDPNFDARDFAFKDSLTGWCSNWSEWNTDTTVAMCYKTTDGGLSWHALRGPARHTSSVLYRPKQHLLLLSGWDTDFPNGTKYIGSSCYSTDDGATWTVFHTGADLNGYAFLNDQTGIVTCRGPHFQRTTDAGYTWTNIANGGHEAWQPLADTTHGLIWAISEISREIFSSSDSGLNFDLLGLLPYTTGTIAMGRCAPYYAQADQETPDKTAGMLLSMDGIHWSSLTDDMGSNGPSNESDTKFCVRGSYLFTGGADPVTGDIGIWRYIGDSTRFGGGNFTAPQTSTHSLSITPHSCDDLDTTLYAVYLNDCLQAELVSASVTPVGAFEVITRDTLPHTISGNYPIRVEYHPTSNNVIHGRLVLTYRVAGVSVQDTITLSGCAAPGQGGAIVDLLVNGAKQATARSGDTVRATLVLTSDVPGTLGLDSITTSIRTDRDELTHVSTDIRPPFSLLSEQRTDSTLTLVVRHLHGEDLHSGTALAEIRYRTTVGATQTGEISLTEIRFNDSSLAACVAATAILRPASVSIEGCGDSVLASFMAGDLGSSLRLARDGGLEVLLARVPYITTVTIELANLGGDLLWSSRAELHPGEQRLRLPSSWDLPSGTYLVRMRTAEGMERRVRFQIAR